MRALLLSLLLCALAASSVSALSSSASRADSSLQPLDAAVLSETASTLADAQLPGSSADVATSPSEGINKIFRAVESSECAQHSFVSHTNRKHVTATKPPLAFVRGMALAFAKQVCQPNRPETLFAAKPATTEPGDVLGQNNYQNIFAAKGLDNSAPGLATLRHVYTLLVGLGMAQSGGQYCAGRNTLSAYTSGDLSEAGLFQVSYHTNTRHPLLDALFLKYVQQGQAGCLLPAFADRVSCSAAHEKNHGAGAGYAFQALSKSCPAFAVEYAAVLVRLGGGAQGDFAPLSRRFAEVRTECDDMFQEVQSLILASPSICAAVLAA